MRGSSLGHRWSVVALACAGVIGGTAAGCGSGGEGHRSPSSGGTAGAIGTDGGATTGGTASVAGAATGGGGAGGSGAAPGGGTGGAAVIPPLPVAADPWHPSAACEARAAEVLAGLNARERAGQMVQADSASVNASSVSTYGLGSILSGGGSDPSGSDSVAAWTSLAQAFGAQGEALGIPILYGIDAVHGHNNVSGAVLFPHNIGLGCTRDDALVREVAAITAREVRGTAMNWTFAPVVAAARNERWGRTYEAFGEDPALAAWLGRAAVEGLQGDSLAGPESVLACAKHFAGDGATQNGVDQGDAVMTEAELRAVAIDQYQPLINAGVGSIMVSFSSFNGSKLSGSTHLLTGVLKGDPATGGLGFEGFLVSDWAAVQQLPGGGAGDAPTATQLATAVNAGLDMIMEPTAAATVVNLLEAAPAADGSAYIPPERIEDAVRRILTVKCEMGLLEPGYSSTADPTLTAAIGSAEHRAVARRAVRESLVVLQNEGAVLPLSKTAKVHVAGSARASLTKQCGGWTIDWQGLGVNPWGPEPTGATTTGTTILAGIEAALGASNVTDDDSATTVPADADAVVLVIGEEPYAEGMGDRSDLRLTSVAPADATALANAASSGKPVVVVLVSGRPLVITDVLDQADAWVAAWLPGSEGSGVADVLFGDAAPIGKLSHSWPASMAQIPINVGDADYDSDPPLYPYGFGLTW